jgi:hypothetical protein
MRLVALLMFAWLYRDAQKAGLEPAASRSHVFVLGIMLSLAVMPVVWAHYLSLLFLLIAYVVAAPGYFSAQAKWALAFLVVFSMGQRLSFVKWFTSSVIYVNSTPELVVLGMFKAVPLVLMVTFLLIHRKELYASYHSPAWKSFEATRY